jgi:hypothetical protein
VFVAETTTGKIVGDLPYLAPPEWLYGLNMVGSWGATVKLGGNGISKEDLDQLADPWRFSIGVSRGSQVLQCGPLVTEAYDDKTSVGQTKLAGSGLWGIFSRRMLVDVAFDPNRIQAETADVTLAWMPLHTIAKRLIQYGTLRPGHSLPIVLPDDDPDWALNGRHYPGYDTAYVAERLMQLTQVQDGPEVEFRPEFTDPTHTAFHWRTRIGQPRLGQLGYPHSWDYGGSLKYLSQQRDGSKQTFEHWSRGSGQERDLLVGHASIPRPALWPALESQDGDHTSATEQPTLDGWAAAAVATYKVPAVTWTAQVRAAGDDGQGELSSSPPIDQIAAGDNGTFRIRGHRRIADGDYPVRVLAVGNGDSTDMAELTLAPLQGVDTGGTE